MFNKKSTLAIISTLILLALLAAPVMAAAGDTTLVSVNTTAGVGNGSSAFPSISPDGRYVAFQSNASNLVAGDVGGWQDIFVRDRGTNTTTLVSVNSSEVQGNASSYRPSISANGRYVAFESNASNLVAGDANGMSDIFVRDIQAGTTTLVSVAFDGESMGNDDSYDPSISADGRYVAFYSSAANLVTGDANGQSDVFVRDLQAGTTTRISVDTGGNDADNWSSAPSISSDGRYVAFESAATDLVAGDVNGRNDIFLRDRTAGVTVLVSVGPGGVQANSGSYGASISADGRTVAFASYATNLVAGDTNANGDIFVRDLQAGATTLVSKATDGTQGNSWSDYPAISPDGRYVAFPSWASNLVAGDTNGTWDAFVHDRTTGLTRLVSVNSSGVQGNSYSSSPVLSSGGNYVAFYSGADNLFAGDTNGVGDVFVREMDPTSPTAVFGAGSVPPSDGANLAAGLSTLLVQFSENVVSGGADGSAEYGGNYLLLQAGPNGAFDTTAASPAICDSDHVGILGDDVMVRIDTITYNAASFTAAITIDPTFAPLANGQYRLYLCGAASIDDLAGNPLNNGANAAVNFTVGAAAPAPALPATGFAPDRVTALSAQPASQSYAGLGDLWLEIPRLGVQMNIVGVPQSGNTWDVSWLGNQAGWLQGTAFPTWNGNSVITGHVWSADNKAGPFVYLNTLWYGDRIIVHAWGQQYVYEVRGVTQVRPDSTVAAFQHKDTPWLTLTTCRSWDADKGTYRYRVLVQAALVSVK
jgi:LPXTG-site transpeptidase (sortase) family protein